MAAKQADKPISVTTGKKQKTVSIVVDGTKYAFPSDPPLDLTLTILDVDQGEPDQRQLSKILRLFRDRILPEELREKIEDLDDILALFTAWSEAVGLEKSSKAQPVRKSRQSSSTSTVVK